MEEKRMRYYSIPTIIGTGFTLMVFFAVGEIGAFFLLLLVHIAYTVVCFKVRFLQNHAVTVCIGIIAGTIGSFWCGSYIKFGSQYGKFSYGYVVWFIILLLIPHAVYLYIAFSKNLKIDEREEQLAAQRREQEMRDEAQRREQQMRKRDQWEREISSQIASIFSINDINRKLIRISEMLESQKNNEEQLQFIKEKLFFKFDEIERTTLTRLSSRDFEGAVTGLKILATLKPSAPQYKNAEIRLQDKRLLIHEMEKNGLSESSPLFTQHYGKLLS